MVEGMAFNARLMPSIILSGDKATRDHCVSLIFLIQPHKMGDELLHYGENLCFSSVMVKGNLHHMSL